MGHPAFFAGVANTMAHSPDSLPGWADVWPRPSGP
jgi:hypothetical protein